MRDRSKTSSLTDGSAQDKRLDREVKLRKRLHKIPLKSFRVGDLNALMRLMHLSCEHAHRHPSEVDLSLLERRARHLKK